MKIISLGAINFHDYSFDEISHFFNRKLLICVPAAPGLANILTHTNYSKSLINSDINIFDSGLFCILLYTKGIFVKKNSGYKLLSNLFSYLKNNNIMDFMLIDPTIEISKINDLFLNNNNIKSKFNGYVAPLYNKNEIFDYELLKILNKKKPKFIIINLGGGTQEILGSWIKDNITFNSVIICTGAAISFFTGEQAKIGKFIDRFYLGWLARCINNPKIFIPRYFKALKFFLIFFKFYFRISVQRK